jgi:small-conductance mechanosensitive channel
LNHLARGYFGGVYTTATQGLGTITDRFYMNDKDLNEKTTGSGLQNAYNKIDEAEQRVNQFNTIVNDLKENKIDRVQFAKDTVGTNFGAAKKIQKLGSRLRDINKTLKENQDFPEEEKNQLREAQKTILKLIEETPLRQAQ